MFFDADEAENGTAAVNGSTGANQTAAKPSAAAVSSNVSASDSILAAIEAGLKYIDSNDQKVGTLLDGTANATVSVTPRPIGSTTTEKELSFLDIFLGDDDDDETPTIVRVQNLTRTTVTRPQTVTEAQSERSTTPRIVETTFIITKYATDRTTADADTISTSLRTEITNEYSTQTEEYSDSTPDLSTTTDQETSDQTTDTTNNLKEITNSETTTNDYDKTSTDSKSDENDSTYTSIVDTTTGASAEMSTTKQSTSNSPSTIASTTPSTTSTVSSISTSTQRSEDLKSNSSPQENPTVLPPTKMRKPTTTPPPRTNHKTPIQNQTTSKITTTTENIFSAFFDGISSIFNEPNGTAAAAAQYNGLNKLYKIRVNTDPNGTHRPTPASQLTGTNTDYTMYRIKNATASIPTKVRPTPIPFISSSTAAPLIINSNPSILESDLSYDYGEPTLPPSLPNLKIIPFLPTDAVKTNRNHLNYGYYNTLPSVSDASAAIEDSSYSFPGESQPVLSIDQLNLSKESKLSLDSNEFELFHVGAQMSGPVGPATADHRYNHGAASAGISPAHDEYVQQSYPAITESIYDLNDRKHFDADTQKKLYAGLQTRTTSGGHDIVTGYEKFMTGYPEKMDFGEANGGRERINQFSPPSETEGWFCHVVIVCRI